MTPWTNIELEVEMPPQRGQIVRCDVNDAPCVAKIVAVGPYLWEIRIRIDGVDLREHYQPADLFGGEGVPMHVNRNGYAMTGIRRKAKRP